MLADKTEAGHGIFLFAFSGVNRSVLRGRFIQLFGQISVAKMPTIKRALHHFCQSILQLQDVSYYDSTDLESLKRRKILRMRVFNWLILQEVVSWVIIFFTGLVLINVFYCICDHKNVNTVELVFWWLRVQISGSLHLFFANNVHLQKPKISLRF